MLTLEHASLTLGQNRFDFSLSANTHSIHAILGRSGSGKSTLLNLIAGFLSPTSGDIRWHGKSLINIPAEKRPVTTLFQQHNLFDHLSVKQNVGLGLHPGLKLNQADRAKIKSVVEDVGLTAHMNKRPTAMSGGEQQRVALARCLLRNRPVLLLDEPFAALDASTRDEMLKLTKEIIERQALCILMVTHNQDDATALNATVLKLEHGRLLAGSTLNCK